MSSLAADFDDIRKTLRRIESYTRRTPALSSGFYNRRLSAQVFFKAENLQRTGSFKFRGACSALTNLSPGEKRRGVIAYSSGNHAQALAKAGRLLDVPVTIVMPHDAPPIKRAATEQYGAEIIVYTRGKESREELGEKIASERGLKLVPPFDMPDIIAGQGTAALELFRETGPLDYLFVCVGGGGLISGSAIVANELSPSCRVIGVEPRAGNDGCLSFRAGERVRVENPETIADGARTECLGVYTFPIIRRFVSDMISVEDDRLVEEMGHIWSRMKIVVEPTGALAIAGAVSMASELADKRVGVLLSGGNVSFPGYR